MAHSGVWPTETDWCEWQRLSIAQSGLAS